MVAAYTVLRLDWEAENANRLLLTSIPARLAYFRDFHGDSAYKLTIADCLRALELGCKKLSWFTSLDSLRFPRAANSHLDMDWIIPGKLVAFKDPTTNRGQERRGISRPVVKELKRLCVKSVVRLNSYDHIANFEYYGSSYHPGDLEREGFEVFDIPFKDVGIPTDKQVKVFIDLCEKSDRAIAVHCHAGLGRTATMIGCYMIKAYEFDSRATCAWMKMCRRGSVMGPQHFFLDKYETQWKNICKGHPKTVARSDEVKKNPLPHEQRGAFAATSSESCPQHQVITRIARPPQKNNIVHIVPAKSRDAATLSSMQKYRPTIPAPIATCIEKVPSKRKLSAAATSDKANQKTGTFPSKNLETETHATKACTTRAAMLAHSTKVVPTSAVQAVSSAATQKVPKTGGTTKEQPQTKRQKQEKSETFAAVRPKVFHLYVGETSKLTATKKRIEARPIQRRGTKSHHDALVRSAGGSSSLSKQLLGSNSWTQGVIKANRTKQWGAQMIGKLVNDSRNRLQSFANTIYAREIQ